MKIILYESPTELIEAVQRFSGPQNDENEMHSADDNDTTALNDDNNNDDDELTIKVDFDSPYSRAVARSYEVDATVMGRMLEHHCSNNSTTSTKQYLIFNKIHLEGSVEDFFRVFSRLKHVVSIRASTCRIHPVRWIRESLVHLPNLKNVVWINITEVPEAVPVHDAALRQQDEGSDEEVVSLPPPILPSFSALTMLVEQTKTLELLLMHSIQKSTSEDEVSAFWLAVQQSPCLEQLRLGGVWLKDRDMPFFARMLKENQTLTHVCIDVKPALSIIPIAKSIVENTSLKELVVGTIFTEGVRLETLLNELEEFAKVLHFDNQTLVSVETVWQLCLDRCKASNINKTAVSLYLRKEVLSNTARCERELEKISFYLTLNRIGRKSVLYSPCRDDWISIIAGRSNISIIFYFLQQNPSMYFGIGGTCL